MSKKYLFLDFDGVLHPYEWDATHFELLPLLYEVVIKHKDSLNIVISSSWKLSQSLEVLKQYFPEDMRDMIVAVTPDLLECRANEGRYKEIELFMKESNLDISNTKWIAIDDEARLYPENCLNLIKTSRYEGINKNSLIKIKEFLES